MLAGEEKKIEVCGSSRTCSDATGIQILPSMPGKAVSAAPLTMNIDGAARPVFKCGSVISAQDRLKTVLVRLNIGRNHYLITPGLYAHGTPDEHADVFVSANYGLSFNALRRALADINAWILVIDTKGVNVWCAAGKGTFATGPIVAAISDWGLARRVSHRRLIVPQLGGPGVCAQDIRRATGFDVIWGPVRAEELPQFLAQKYRADSSMRRVRFTFYDRFILVPVEVALVLKPAFYILFAIFFLSGLSRAIFSWDQALSRFPAALAAMAAAIVAGAILTPLGLPWLPGRSFSIKALAPTALLCIPIGLLYASRISGAALAALILFIFGISTYLAMNFTGATPYTSPSGVEKEMRRAIPFQLTAMVLALGLWIYAGLSM